MRAENAQLLGDIGLLDVKHVHEIGNRARILLEQLQNLQPCRFGEDSEKSRDPRESGIGLERDNGLHFELMITDNAKFRIYFLAILLYGNIG